MMGAIQSLGVRNSICCSMWMNFCVMPDGGVPTLAMRIHVTGAAPPEDVSAVLYGEPTYTWGRNVLLVMLSRGAWDSRRESVPREA